MGFKHSATLKLILLLVSLANISGCSNSDESNPPKPKLLETANLFFEVSYPRLWSVRENISPERGTLLIRSNRLIRQAHCVLEASSKPDLIDDEPGAYIDFMFPGEKADKLLKNFSDADMKPELISASPLDKGGVPAFQVELYFTENRTLLRGITVQFLDRGVFHNIACAETPEHYEEASPFFEKIISSYKGYGLPRLK